MRILVSFYSKTGRTRAVAQEIADELGSQHEVVLHAVVPKREMKAHHYNKDGKKLALLEPISNVKGFDLVFVGTPVWGFCPSPIILAYLRQLKSAEKKRFALFSTCTVLPGTTMKRMSNLLAMKNASVVDSLMIRSVFDLDSDRLKEARAFAKKVAESTL